MLKMLFYVEDTPYPNHIGWWAGCFDMHYLIVDRKGRWLARSKHQWVYRNVTEAIEDPDHIGYEWAWLHPDGDIFLDEYLHPKDKVIYCLGSDYVGFDGLPASQLPGVTLKLRQPERHEGEWFAGHCCPLVCYDRLLYNEGRRAI